MPATLSYPGVYIDEVPSGARAIVGVSTAVTAFVGRARRGPVGEPVDIASFGDFERIFGGVWRLGTLGHAVQMYFQNGGNRAVVVRLYEPAGPGPGPAATAEVKVGQAALEAVSPGTWASGLRVTVDWSVSDDVAAALGVAAADLFNLEIRDGDGNREYIRNVSLVSTPRALARVLPLESSLVRMKPASPALDALIAGVVTARTNLAAAVAQSAAAQAATPQVPADITAAAAAVTAATTALTTAQTAVRPAATATAAVGGNDGANLTVASFTGNNAAANKTGLYALDRTDLFNLLCIPPFTATDDVDPALFADVVPLCERRRAMFLVGSPSTWTTVAAAQSNIGGFGITSANAALFFPRLRLPDPTRGGELRDFSACAAAAGVFARTDSERGLWKAPAGQDAALVGVPGLSVSLNDADNGLLNPLGINCIRALPAAGRVIWGARTRRGDDRLASEWKYTPIRRLALFIEESLYRGTQWVVFEPNDELLWSQIRLDVTAFMQGLFRQGALQGKTPREAYYVRCDRDTTTAADQRLGVVNINVGFAPLKPAEFVVLRIQQIVDTGTSEA